MTERARRRSLPSAFALVAAVLGPVHCSREVIAVDVAGTADGGETYSWPVSGMSTANSDPWLMAHHDNIVEMHPRVLMLDFCNGLDSTRATERAQDRIAAIAEGSRYHGYNDVNSPAPFLMYDLIGVRDLTDHTFVPNRRRQQGGGGGGGPGGCVPSTSFPITNNVFDPSQLFGQIAAGFYGMVDPANSSRSLTLCELFKLGIINEVWIMVDQDALGVPMSATASVPFFLERKQKYDNQMPPKAIPGVFEDTGYQAFPALDPSLQCDATVRIAFVRPETDASCDLMGPAIAMANTHRAIPYVADNGLDFFNEDFNTRYVGAQFAGWPELVALGANGWCTSPGTACIGYPSTNVVQGSFPDGRMWTINPFVQGCGTPLFPPNTRFQGDWGNAQAVSNRCEHYNMRDGSGGTDTTSLYSSSTPPAAYAQRFGSACNAPWQLYLRQNMPGLNNLSYDVHGSRMKNWWPFLFY